MRRVLAVFAGMMLGGLVVALLEAMGAAIWPPPPAFDPENPDYDLLLLSATSGQMVYQVVVFGLGAFVGTFVAKKAAGEAHMWEGGIVGALMLMATVSNFFAFPHPWWMMGMSVVAVAAGAYGALRLGPPRLED